MFFSTHSRRGNVHVRKCNEGHPECELRWSGLDDLMYRHSYDIIVAAEVIVSCWEFLLDGKGPGLSAYHRYWGKQYILAGSPELPFGVDTLRETFFGYYCIAGVESNRPCPSATCPIFELPSGEKVQHCPDLQYDAQRMRIRKKELRTAPTTVFAEAPTIDCRNFTRACERLFWPGGPSTHTGALREILGAVCRVTLHTLSAAEQSSQVNKASAEKVTHLRASCPAGYASAVEIVLSAFERKLTAIATGSQLVLTSMEKCVAELFEAISCNQCEAVQYLNPETAEIVREVLSLSATTGFSFLDTQRWRKEPGMRNSIVDLIVVSRQERDPANAIKPFTLNASVHSLLQTLSERVRDIHYAASSMPDTPILPDADRPVYDPLSAGTA